VGLRESVMGAATLALGAMFSEGVASSLLNRVTMMFVYITMGLIFAIPVLRRFNRGKGHLNRNEEPEDSELYRQQNGAETTGDSACKKNAE